MATASKQSMYRTYSGHSEKSGNPCKENGFSKIWQENSIIIQIKYQSTLRSDTRRVIHHTTTPTLQSFLRLRKESHSTAQSYHIRYQNSEGDFASTIANTHQLISIAATVPTQPPKIKGDPKSVKPKEHSSYFIPHILINTSIINSSTK